MKENKIIKEIISWMKHLIFAFICFLIINNYIIASAVVVSSSMENTVMTDSRVMGLRVSYIIINPGRYDIILFDPPDDTVSIPYVKRIIGLPNETINIIDGKVYIDDSNVPLDDSFIKDTARGNFGPFNVPDNCYFVMGDNRNSSNDSRHWSNRYVPKKNIIGRLYVEFYPSPHILE